MLQKLLSPLFEFHRRWFSAISVSFYLYYSVQGYPYWTIKQQVRLQIDFYIVHPRTHRKNVASKASVCWYELALTLKSEKKPGETWETTAIRPLSHKEKKTPRWKMTSAQ